MADVEHLTILKQGVTAWNAWREKSPTIRPDLIRLSLRHTNLREANLSGARLRRANMDGTNLSRANLSGADLQQARIVSNSWLNDKWSLIWRVIHRTEEGDKPDKADLTLANLSRANLNGANLRRVNLNGANLSQANLSRADLSRVNLSEADLSLACLLQANLCGANLLGTNLNWADLRKARIDRYTQLGSKWSMVWRILNQTIRDKKFSRADLSRASLKRANLSQADLSHADLSGAELFQADLSGANLSRANLRRADLRRAKFWSDTRLIGKWNWVWRTVHRTKDDENLSKADLSLTNLSGAKLNEVDLKGINLCRGDLSKANLRNANLSDANLIEANLSEANLLEADLSRAKLIGASLNRANLSWANLAHANLRVADLSEAELSWVESSGANLNGADLSGATLGGSNFFEAQMSRADLSEADLNRADLSEVDLGETNLWNANLSGANLCKANLNGARLSRANLSRANLSWANLSGADLCGANLSGAILSRADLSEAALRGANLSGADLSRADLRGTDLEEAYLSQTNMNGVNLNGDNLEKNENFDDTSIGDVAYYGLTLEPFRLTPDHRMCFVHPSYQKAKTSMEYAVRRREGFIMITGEPGTGKTTLIYDLLDNLPTENLVTAKLDGIHSESEEFLRLVALSFGLEGETLGKSMLLHSMRRFLTEQSKEGRKGLLIVDECQALSPSALEELRLLSNLQDREGPLLQVFLVGQESLLDVVRSPSMVQLHQRLIAACHLDPLDVGQTEAYIVHRLRKVGWKGNPELRDDIFPLIHQFSRGVPRRVNLICSRLLFSGYVQEKHALGIEDVQHFIRDMREEKLIPSEFVLVT